MVYDIEKIAHFYRVKGRMPRIRELQILLGNKSMKMTYIALEELINNEYIYRDEKGKLKPYKLLQTPILGSIKAGLPENEEEYEDWVDVKDLVLKEPEKTFLLRVEGDSMKDAGIHNGDLAVVERGRVPKEGNVVVANVDGCWTLKYLRYSGDTPYLAPANKNYSVIIPQEELKIPAVVIAVIKNF